MGMTNDPETITGRKPIGSEPWDLFQLKTKLLLLNYSWKTPQQYECSLIPTHPTLVLDTRAG